MNSVAVLHRVRNQCLHKQPVPEDLAVLWSAQLAGDSPVADRCGEVTLLEKPRGSAFATYKGKAWRSMFVELAFVGVQADGGLIAYWLFKKACKLGDAPIVVLDNEGQLALSGRTLSDHFVAEGGAFAQKWFAQHGIKTRRTRAAVEASLRGLPDPAERYAALEAQYPARRKIEEPYHLVELRNHIAKGRKGGDLRFAELLANATLDNHSDDAVCFTLRAEIRLELGKVKGALADCKKALHLAPESTEAQALQRRIERAIA